MAAVAYADGTERRWAGNESMVRTWSSPATMDSADTVTVPTVNGATVTVIDCIESTTGDSVTATVSGYTITVNAAGSDTNDVYVITYMYNQG